MKQSWWVRTATEPSIYADCHTFELATDLVAQLDRATRYEVFPLSDYKTAIEHAAQAGPRGLIKVAFDLRNDS